MKKAAARSWKTTLMGIAMLLSLGLDMAVKTQTQGVIPALMQVLNDPTKLAVIGGGVGLVCAKDADKAGSGSTGQ